MSSVRLINISKHKEHSESGVKTVQLAKHGVEGRGNEPGVGLRTRQRAGAAAVHPGHDRLHAEDAKYALL